MHDERLTSLRAELARLTEQSGPLGPEAAEELTLQTVLTVVTALPDIVAAVSPDGRFLFVNRVVEGLTLQAVIGTSVYDFMPEEGAARARAAIERVVATGEPATYEATGPGEHGPESSYRTRCLPIPNQHRVIAVALVVTDITPEVRRRTALRDSETRQQLALSASGAGLWSVDVATRSVTLDVRATAIMGLTETAPDLDGMFAMVHSGDRKRVQATFAECVRGMGPFDIEHRARLPDGSIRWVALEGLVLQSARGEAEQIIGTVRDVTERHHLEDQLRQSQKLEAVGQLTAGIAHNFNNLLAIILPNLELAAEGASAESQHFLHQAENATVRAAELVRKLMTFSGKNRRSNDKTAEPGRIVESAVAISEATFDRSIDIRVSIEPGLPACGVDPSELEQAVMNVLLNARDAVADADVSHKRISVIVEKATPDPPVEPRPLGWTAIRVVDNGTGMSEAVRQRALEPFFTTKEVGKGTGLGLAMTYAMLRAVGGHVDITSSADGGTVVTLWLPAVDPTVTPSDQGGDAPSTTDQADTPLVLAVDDEQGVRNLIRAMLERAGFAVITAPDGESATAILHRVDPAVMILDLSMPGQNWRHTLDNARRARPGMRVLIYTGLAVEADDSGADAVLQKPASGAQLVDAVRRVLTSEPS